MDTLIAEDLLLLLLDDDSGKLTGTTYLDTGLGGAVLIELALLESVQVEPGQGWFARAKVVATDAPLPTDPLLVESLELVRAKDRTAQDLVTRLGKGRRDVLLGRLRERGILDEREERVLGLVPRRRWPTRDASHESAVRREIGDVLVRGAEPGQRIAALIALLSALDLAHKVIDHEGLTGREVKKRAKEVAEGDWAAKAVRDAIAAAQAAVTAAIVASTAATTTVST